MFHVQLTFHHLIKFVFTIQNATKNTYLYYGKQHTFSFKFKSLAPQCTDETTTTPNKPLSVFNSIPLFGMNTSYDMLPPIIDPCNHQACYQHPEECLSRQYQ